MSKFHIAFLFILIILLQACLVQPKSAKAKNAKSKLPANTKLKQPKPEQEQDFFINLLFAFCVLPFLLFYLEGGIDDDHEFQILIAIFLWVAIAAGYYWFKERYQDKVIDEKLDDQTKKELLLKSKIMRQSKFDHELLHKISSKRQQSLTTSIRGSKKIEGITQQQIQKRIQNISHRQWILELHKKKGIVKCVETKLQCFNINTRTYGIKLKTLKTEQSMEGKLHFNATTEHIELKNSKIQCQGGFIQKEGIPRFEGTWKKAEASSGVFKLIQKVD